MQWFLPRCIREKKRFTSKFSIIMKEKVRYNSNCQKMAKVLYRISGSGPKMWRAYNNLWGHFRAIFWSIQLPFFLQKRKRQYLRKIQLVMFLMPKPWVFGKWGFRILLLLTNLTKVWSALQINYFFLMYWWLIKALMKVTLKNYLIWRKNPKIKQEKLLQTLGCFLVYLEIFFSVLDLLSLNPMGYMFDTYI